jgi:hypothetical protein
MFGNGSHRAAGGVRTTGCQEVSGSAQLPRRVRFQSNSQYKLSLLTSVALLSDSLVIPERHS